MTCGQAAYLIIGLLIAIGVGLIVITFRSLKQTGKLEE